MSFPAFGIGSGVLGFRPYWCPSPFPSLSILGVFHSLLSAIAFQSVPRQFVYGQFVYDTSSTDISSTTVYQRTGQLYIQLLFQQIIILINYNFYLQYDSFLSIPLPLTL